MKTPLARFLQFLLSLLLLASLVACGGGGNSSGTSLLGSSSSATTGTTSGTSGTSTSSTSTYTVALATSATAVSTAGNATETATVTNASGAPQAGVSVTFLIGSNSSGATLSSGQAATGGSSTSVTAVTNSSGQAWVTYTAGASAGTDAVIAQATPSTSGAATAYGSVSITVSPGTASSNSESIQFVPGTTVTVAPGVQVEFGVKVLSGGTTPVVGATVAFTLASNSSGATLNGGSSTVNVTTGADGTAYVRYQAGGSSGTTDTVSASVLNGSSVALATATQQVTISASGTSKYLLALSGTTEPAGTACVTSTNTNGNSLSCSLLATDVMAPSAAVQTVGNGVTLTGVVTDINGNPVRNMAVLFSFGSATTAGYIPYCNLTNASGTPSCTDGGKTGTSATGQVQPGFVNAGGTLQSGCIAAETDVNGFVTVRYAAGGVTGVDTVIASVTPGSVIDPNSPQTCPSSLSTIYVTQSASMAVSVQTTQP